MLEIIIIGYLVVSICGCLQSLTGTEVNDPLVEIVASLLWPLSILYFLLKIIEGDNEYLAKVWSALKEYWT